MGKLGFIGIIKLKKFLKKWKSTNGKSNVRSGSVGVYVGPTRERFVVPTQFLNFKVFTALLEKAEVEFGHPTTGGIRLPCDAVFFEWMVNTLRSDEKRFKEVGLDELLKIHANITIHTFYPIHFF